MKSKTSCFNRTIFMKNIVRFWPMWVLYLVLMILLMPFSIYQTSLSITSQRASASQIARIGDCLSNALQINTFLVFAFAASFALLVYGYLFQSRNCYMMHAFPVKRRELLTTNFLSSFLFLAVPQIIAFLISLVVCVINNITCVEALLYWLIFSVLMSFFFSASATFCCMLTGNAFAAAVYYFVGNLLYVGLKSLVCSVIQTLCFGMGNFLTMISNLVSQRDGFLSPFSFMLTRMDIYTIRESGVATGIGCRGMGIALAYLIPAVILLILSYVFYEKRQLECAGNAVAFQWLYPVFRWLVSICFGLALGQVFAAIFFQNTAAYQPSIIAACIIFGFIVFFLSEMILQKSFRVFKKSRWIEAIVFVAVGLFFLLSLEGDLFHIERRIPAESSIERVLVTLPNYAEVADTPEDIQAVQAIHQLIIDHKQEIESDRLAARTDSTEETELSSFTANLYTMPEITITYFLQNGKEVTRSYSILVTPEDLQDSDNLATIITAQLITPEKYVDYYFCKNREDMEFTGGSLDYPRMNPGESDYFYETLSISDTDAQIIYQALLQDILEGNYPFSYENFLISERYHYANTLYLNCQIKDPETIYDELPTEYQNRYSPFVHFAEDFYGNTVEESAGNYYIELYTTCTHTKQALLDTGIVEDESQFYTIYDLNQYDDAGKTEDPPFFTEF